VLGEHARLSARERNDLVEGFCKQKAAIIDAYLGLLEGDESIVDPCKSA
jgi:hypothetical protein